MNQMTRTITLRCVALASLAAFASACSGTDSNVCASGVRCLAGEQCAADQDVCITDGCGDGIIDPQAGEMCDDGNITGGDGCSADCRSDETCGNSYIDRALGEVCDGDADGLECNAACQLLDSCGNGVIDPGEECDTHALDTPRCNRDCTRARCGDALINRAAGEQCDTGGDSAGCDSDCTLAACGDGHLNPFHGVPGETCDAGRDTGACDTDCTPAQCGDGYYNRVAEVCDDDGESPYCTAQCTPGPWCDATCTADSECRSGRCVAGLCQAARLTAGRDHSCVLLAHGGVRCWGYGDAGRLGYGDTANIGDNETPAGVGDVDLGGLDGLGGLADVIQLAAGDYHTCALLGGGAVRCWGQGALGRLGYGDTEDIGDEVEDVAGDIALGGPATQITAGRSHTCALLDTGGVRCWGDGSSGQLGYGNRYNIGDDELPDQAGTVQVGGRVIQLAAGERHTCALLETGVVMCWGDGSSGQLGYGDTDRIGDDETPAERGVVAVGGLVIQLAAGNEHTCALLENRRIRCWGRGSLGRLGYGDTDNIGDVETPAERGDIDVGGLAVQITAGAEHTCALLDTGELRCWGQGSGGRLGYGDTANIGDDELPVSALPIDIGGWPGASAVEIHAGGHHTCALLDSCRVRCWGDGDFGRLGHGDTDSIGDDERPAAAAGVRYR